jgi:hypothetical protein
MYIIILAINCHSLFCLGVVSHLQCRSSILVFILFIYVIYLTNHQNHCKCKMQMSVILFSHGLLDWFNKTILFYSILFYTSIDDRHCRGETTPRQNKLWQFIANIMIYIKNIYYTNITWCRYSMVFISWILFYL